MDTMWRSITVKTRRSLRCGFFLFFCASVLLGVGESQSALSPSGANSTSNGSKAAGASQGSALVVLPNDISQLRIAPGDLLRVNVYDTPELTDAYRVDVAGNLTLPLCGKVKVQGLTASEAAESLQAALKNGQILTQPQVTVDVQQYAGQYVTVLGEVINPGRVALIAPTMLSEILAQVGGLTPLAGSHITIRHGDNDSTPEEQAPYSRSQGNRQTESLLVRPGDSVIVQRTGIVYVLGAVNRPGGYVMQEDGQLNVAQALALSGGTLMQAKTNGLRVIRRNPDGTALEFDLSYTGIAKGTQNPMALQAQDIVYVPMSKVKATLSDTTSILSSATSAAIYMAR
jgi:polysaccharide export outer membrane protein